MFHHKHQSHGGISLNSVQPDIIFQPLNIYIIVIYQYLSYCMAILSINDRLNISINHSSSSSTETSIMGVKIASHCHVQGASKATHSLFQSSHELNPRFRPKSVLISNISMSHYSIPYEYSTKT